MDYITTCPLLTFTLMGTLNLPYKYTCSVLMGMVIMAGYMSMWSASPGRYMWYCMGCAIFGYTWYNVVILCQVRFMQYFGKKHRIGSQQSAERQSKKKRASFATNHGLRDKRLRGPIQTFLAAYFVIWMGYPILWLLEEFKLLNMAVIYVCHVVLDVAAKVLFGFCIMKFQFVIDKLGLRMENLTVTLADMIDDYQQAHKADKEARRAKNRHEEKYGNSEIDSQMGEDEEEYDENYGPDMYGSQDMYSSNQTGMGGMGGMGGAAMDPAVYSSGGNMYPDNDNSQIRRG